MWAAPRAAGGIVGDGGGRPRTLGRMLLSSALTVRPSRCLSLSIAPCCRAIASGPAALETPGVARKSDGVWVTGCFRGCNAPTQLKRERVPCPFSRSGSSLGLQRPDPLKPPLTSIVPASAEVFGAATPRPIEAGAIASTPPDIGVCLRGWNAPSNCSAPEPQPSTN